MRAPKLILLSMVAQPTGEAETGFKGKFFWAQSWCAYYQTTVALELYKSLLQVLFYRWGLCLQRNNPEWLQNGTNWWRLLCQTGAWQAQPCPGPALGVTSKGRERTRTFMIILLVCRQSCLWWIPHGSRHINVHKLRHPSAMSFWVE
jgi:hypothetical protein